jgi:hypothetical protein
MFCQKYFENGLNEDTATNVEVIRSLFGLATAYKSQVASRKSEILHGEFATIA